MVCPTLSSAQTLSDDQKCIGTELQHFWAMVTLGSACAKREIFLQPCAHVCFCSACAQDKPIEQTQVKYRLGKMQPIKATQKLSFSHIHALFQFF